MILFLMLKVKMKSHRGLKLGDVDIIELGYMQVSGRESAWHAPGPGFDFICGGKHTDK